MGKHLKLIIEDADAVLETFHKRMDKLTAVMHSAYPIIPDAYEAHERRVENAALYVDELSEALVTARTCTCKLYLSWKSFSKEMDKGDWITISFNGQFVKIVLISIFKEAPYFAIYMAPMSQL